MNPLMRMVVRQALRVGRRRNLKYARIGRKAPWWLETRYRFFEARVFRLLREAIGIDHGNIFPTAGAPVSTKVVEFFHACGINIVVGYGLSETTATVCCFPQTGWEIGSVGTPIPLVNVRIGENDEVLVKSPMVMRGYYNNPRKQPRHSPPTAGSAPAMPAISTITAPSSSPTVLKTSSRPLTANISRPRP